MRCVLWVIGHSALPQRAASNSVCDGSAPTQRAEVLRNTRRTPPALKSPPPPSPRSLSQLLKRFGESALVDIVVSTASAHR